MDNCAEAIGKTLRSGPSGFMLQADVGSIPTRASIMLGD